MSTDAAYAVFAASPLLREVHGPHYLNVGWRGAGGDPSAVLVDRLLAWVPQPPALVVDVACGRGAAATRVWSRWPGARVVALDRSAALLSQRVGAPWAVRADATALPLPTGRAGVVLCVEAALHFADRGAFFAEAARVLRPGGLLLLADLLVDPARAGWAPLVPAGNAQRTPAEYAACLHRAGLRVRHAADVTEYTWRPYRRALVGAARGERARRATERLLADRPAYAYVEAVAQR